MRSTAVQSPEPTDIEATGSCDSPSAPRVAALDLGSKNFKAVLGELQDRRVVTRLLGKCPVGVGADIVVNQGVISEETLDRARTALAELKIVCERAGSTEFLAVATRAIRAARNGEDIVDAARELGVEVEIATGEREAELGYLAVTNGKAGSLVCELGSQSMQLAWRQSGPIQSIAIGAGYERVYDEFIRDAASFSQARGAYAAFLDGEIRSLPESSDEFIGMAMNSMAGFITGVSKSQVTDRNLSRARVREKKEALNGLTESEFGRLKASTPKGDKILSGLILFDYMLGRTGHEQGFIAESELSVGLIVEHFENGTDR